MKVKKLSVLTIVFSCLFVFQFSGAVRAETSGSMELIQLLTTKLGVTKNSVARYHALAPALSTTLCVSASRFDGKIHWTKQ